MTALRSEMSSYKAIGIASGLERLALVGEDDDAYQLSSHQSSKDPDWDAVHFTIQDLLKTLIHRVRASCPEVRTVSGRTGGPAFPLFSYVSFDLGPNETIDAVVVGIDVRANPRGGYRLEGSIGGEESGRIDYEVESVVLDATTEAVLAEASRLARQLIGKHKSIAQVILSRPPLPSY